MIMAMKFENIEPKFLELGVNTYQLMTVEHWAGKPMTAFIGLEIVIDLELPNKITVAPVAAVTIQRAEAVREINQTIYREFVFGMTARRLHATPAEAIPS
jgi:hypothetical protein